MTKKQATSELELINDDPCETKAEQENTSLEMENAVAPGVNEQTKPSPESERITQLEGELQLAKQAKDEFYNRMLRTQADFDNFRRRSRQENEQLALFAGEGVVKKVLPVLDSLERAIGCFKEGTDNTSWQDGVQLTLKQFQEVLKSEGLEAVEALNKEFDPQVHEALFQEESGNVNVSTVVEELQKGYKFKGKLLRPALVKVAVPKLS